MKRKNVLLMMNNGKFLDGVADYAAAHGWRITLSPDGSLSRGWVCDGVLVSFARRGDDVAECTNSLMEHGTPVVALSCMLPSVRVPRVTVDFAGCGHAAARYLADRNYKSFVFCTSEMTYGAEMAYKSFLDELRRNGYGGNAALLVLDEQISEANAHDWRTVTDSVMGVLKSIKPPFGVYAFSDSAAIPVMDAAIEMGLSVPEDVGVMGTGDSSIFCENQDIPLTSINTNLKELAVIACESLDRLMNGEVLETQDVYVPVLGIFERASTGIPKVGNPVIEKAFAIMNRHLSEPLSLVSLANELGMTPGKLNRVFHDAGCTTPASQLRMLRIRKAKTILRTTDLTLGEIAEKTGFAHAAHFLNVFRDLVGETPTAWRDKWR